MDTFESIRSFSYARERQRKSKKKGALRRAEDRTRKENEKLYEAWVERRKNATGVSWREKQRAREASKKPIESVQWLRAIFPL